MLSESLWIFGVCWEDWWFSGAFCFVFFNYSFFYFHKVWSVYPFIFLPHLCHTPGMFALSPCFVYLSQRYSSSTHKVGVATFFFFPPSSSVPAHKMVVRFEGGGCGIKMMGPCNESTNFNNAPQKQSHCGLNGWLLHHSLLWKVQYPVYMACV